MRISPKGRLLRTILTGKRLEVFLCIRNCSSRVALRRGSFLNQSSFKILQALVTTKCLPNLDLSTPEPPLLSDQVRFIPCDGNAKLLWFPKNTIKNLSGSGHRGWGSIKRRSLPMRVLSTQCPWMRGSKYPLLLLRTVLMPTLPLCFIFEKGPILVKIRDLSMSFRIEFFRKRHQLLTNMNLGASLRSIRSWTMGLGVIRSLTTWLTIKNCKKNSSQKTLPVLETTTLLIRSR